MAWITTKNGKRINTDWFEKDKQIENNRKVAEKLNGKTVVNKASLKYNSKVPPIGNSGELRDSLKRDIDNAKKLGYEIIPRTTTQGSRKIELKEYSTDVKVKSSDAGKELKVTKASKLGKHLEEVRSQYNDVIVLPRTGIKESVARGRHGFSTSYNVEYVVMARRKK